MMLKIRFAPRLKSLEFYFRIGFLFACRTTSVVSDDITFLAAPA